MRDLTASMQEKLASGLTTFCHCWLLERTDGVKLGFTDHDENLSFDGVTYEALAGMTASAVTQTLSLNVDTMDIAGALQSDHLNEADLAAGLYNNAALTLYLVDWTDVTDRDIVFAGSVGEISRGLNAFTAEMRGLSHALNQERGRIYQRACDADLGDGRCTVNLDSPTYKGNGTVDGVSSGHVFSASGLDGFSDGWFTGGKLVWTSGANQGAAIEVKTHVNTGTEVSFELWESMAFDIVAGEQFTVRAGCDKSLDTCIAKFGNVANFRGFPFIPGNDAVVSYPNTGDRNDGKSRLGG
ncbi:phage conserved hypothetical protein BR0599 [Chelatococcus sambhunathii]|uniref:Bacteriophage phiJL001 Gp84 C-terminal domain-containing protein n=1 Tax=Chelatococcus sambhunathii TaxID=363953 RepID=A0ABP2A8D9_9HYPH|nr:DUF2163 domain-containing protein [Chelatococcus sambhunathii]CUA90599.1 phage conserved hypothetical protein BR0599 [Chelatococcus sambhunathii]